MARKHYSNRQHLLREWRLKTEQAQRAEAERRERLRKPKSAIAIIKHYNRDK